jgi:hypothetical protein
MDNQDMINPQNSFNKLASLSLPKVTLTFLPLVHPYLPMVAFSYGEAFHNGRSANWQRHGAADSSRPVPSLSAENLQNDQTDANQPHTQTHMELARVGKD